MMTLYHTPTSPFARKVRIAILERGLDDLVRIQSATVRTPENEVLQHHATGKVPALVVEEGADKGLVLVESSLICEYLEQFGDAPGLIPAGGPAHWQERSLDAYAHALMDSLAWRTREFRRPEDERSPGFVAYERERAERCYADLEARVAELESVEISAGRILMAIALDYALYRFPEQDWRPACPKLADWYARMLARPSFQATAP